MKHVSKPAGKRRKRSLAVVVVVAVKGSPIRIVAVPAGGEFGLPENVKVVTVVGEAYVPQVVLVTVAWV